MSRFVWLIALASVSVVACAGSGKDESGTDEGNEPAAPDDGTDGESPGDVQPGTFVSDGADGLRLEMSRGATPSSYRCDNTCSAVCTDCMFEACMATGGDAALCVRSRDACKLSCGLCPEGGTAVACYAPCLKGEPTCYVNLDIVMPDDVMPDDVMPDDVVRPDVTPEREQVQGEEVTPDEETQPSSQSTPSSSSSRGSSGRPAD